MILCYLVGYLCGASSSLHIQGLSEMLGMTYKTTWCYYPENHNPHKIYIEISLDKMVVLSLGLCNAWLFSSGEGTVFWHTRITLTYVFYEKNVPSVTPKQLFNNVHLILCSFELSTPALPSIAPDNRDTEPWSENISHKCYILCSELSYWLYCRVNIFSGGGYVGA
jgi:hypothetical protein